MPRVERRANQIPLRLGAPTLETFRRYRLNGRSWYPEDAHTGGVACLVICGTLDESHDPACGNAHDGSAGRADVRAGHTDGREGPVPQLQGRARLVRTLGLHPEGVEGGRPRDPARLPRGCARYVARAEREGALGRRQEKALLPAHRPDRASHQRVNPRRSGPREGADQPPRPGPERDTGRSSLADRTRGEVQGARIDEREARNGAPRFT